MKLIKQGNLNKLIAEEGYLLKSKEDNYVPAHIDEYGNEVEEHLPYFFTYAYLPDNITLEMAQSMYDELPVDEKSNKLGE